MNSIDKQYQALLQDILDNGVTKQDRTQTGTISVFGRQIRHKMSDGFPLLTTKKMAWKSIVTELLWFLRGDTNIKYLVDNDCHIWDGDAYQGYLKRVGNGLQPATKERFIEMIKNGEESRVDANGWRIGELGPIYGKQWRKWTKKKMYLSTDGSYEKIYDEMDQTVIDQISILINELKTNPDSRRLMVSAWNVGELDQMVLPPCHYGFQVYTRELSGEERWELLRKKVGDDIFKNWVDDIMPFGGGLSEELRIYNIPTRAISLMWNQRSVDTFLGLPFNIASYGLLLEIIAKEVNMVPDELIGNLGDTHLYSNHIEQAKEQIGRELTVEERVKLYEDKTNTDTTFFPILSETLDFHNIPKRTREPYPLPTVTLPSGLQPDSGNWDKLVFEDFYLNNYQSHPSIKAPLSN